jgi:hypothetical protein
MARIWLDVPYDDRHDAKEHVAVAFDIWAKRNRATWTLDLSMLKDAGIEIKTPPSARDRSERTSSR